jgi:hypothetical protein
VRSRRWLTVVPVFVCVCVRLLAVCASWGRVAGERTAAREAERLAALEAEAEAKAKAEAKAAKARNKMEVDEMERLEQARHWAQTEWELEQRERKRVAAATCIQSAWRARPARAAFLRQRRAALTVQRCVRASVAFMRKKVAKSRRRLAATAIQVREGNHAVSTLSSATFFDQRSLKGVSRLCDSWGERAERRAARTETSSASKNGRNDAL